MIPNTTASAYETYDGSADYQYKDERMCGLVRGKDALIGWITVALTTARGEYPIFSRGFGVDLTARDDKALEQSIRETLLRDERIRSVETVKITRERGEVSAHIRVQSIWGACETETTLNV